MARGGEGGLTMRMGPRRKDGRDFVSLGSLLALLVAKMHECGEGAPRGLGFLAEPLRD